MTNESPKRATSMPFAGVMGSSGDAPTIAATGVSFSSTTGCISRCPYAGGTIGMVRRE